MRKFTFTLFIAMLLTGSSFAQCLRVTKFINPAPQGNVPINVPTNWTVKIRNWGPLAVTAGASLQFTLFGYNPQTQQVTKIGDCAPVTLANQLNNNDSTDVSFVCIGLNTGGQTGTGYLGFSVSWTANPDDSTHIIIAGFALVAGIEDVSQSFNKLYYNQGSLYMNLNNVADFKANNAQLSICNLTGQTILNQNISLHANTEMVLPTGILSEGIYILRLMSKEGVATRKFIVQ